MDRQFKECPLVSGGTTIDMQGILHCASTQISAIFLLQSGLPDYSTDFAPTSKTIPSHLIVFSLQPNTRYLVCLLTPFSPVHLTIYPLQISFSHQMPAVRTNNSILAIFMQKQITAFIFGFRPQFKSWSDYISSKSSLPVLLSSDIFSTFRTPLKWHGIPSYMSFQFSFNSYLMLRFAYTHFHFLCKAGELSCWVVSQKTQVIVDTIVDTM